MQDDALAKVTDMLTAHPEINVIWACNDGGTIGAAMAVQQAGLAGKVFVFGYDGGDQQTSMMLSGENHPDRRGSPGSVCPGLQGGRITGFDSAEQANPDAGKITVVPGTYLSVSDLDAVKQWRTDNGLK